MKTRHLNPAQCVLKIFGGVRPAARAIGRSPSSISAWSRKRKTRGMKGSVPRKAQLRILALAKSMRLDVTANDLTLGRDMAINGR